MSELTDIIKPYLDKLKKLTLEADKILIDPEGENVLLTILEAEQEIVDLKEKAKLILEQKALKLNPNFSSIQADKVKVYYREYGSKYYLDETQKDLVPEGMLSEKISYSINSKAVEDWVNEKGHMPTGIRESDRNKTLSISLKNGQ